MLDLVRYRLFIIPHDVSSGELSLSIGSITSFTTSAQPAKMKIIQITVFSLDI